MEASKTTRSSEGNPHKTRRATVPPVRGKGVGKGGTGNAAASKHAGNSNEPHGTTNRQSY